MIVNFNKEQERLLLEMNLPFDFNKDLTNEQLRIIEKKAYDMSVSFVDDDYNIHGDGLVYESIGDLAQDLRIRDKS